MISATKIIRFFVRLFFLSAALLLVIGGPLPVWTHRIVPAASPLVALNEALAQRTWYMSFYWLIAPSVILLAAIWRGRIFCRWVCPAGSVFSTAAAVNRKTPLKKLDAFYKKHRFLNFRIAPYIFYITLFASLAGFTSLLSLDPLSSFTRVAHHAAGWAAWVPGAVIPVFIILGIFKPLLWCAQVCPLGYMFDFFKTYRVKKQVNPQTVSHERRLFLAGLFIGVPSAIVARKLFSSGSKPLILPPGATGTDHFAATCTRCYACVNVCPAKIITVKPKTNLAQAFMPEVDFSQGDKVCIEQCDNCVRVCPTGAIRTLSLKAKQKRQIARAKIRRKDCIAWNDNQVCAVCDEYCPYNAIDITFAPEDTYKDIPLPIIDPDRCRGCGYCKSACVAPHPNKAIDILPVARQRNLDV